LRVTCRRLSSVVYDRAPWHFNFWICSIFRWADFSLVVARNHSPKLQRISAMFVRYWEY
jgi:hypothetical protein